MAINFPNNPAVNDTFTVGGTTFTFTGVKWETSAVVEISSDTTPSLGGTLDAGTNNIDNVGVITATTFSGNVTGNVTGNLTGNADTATAATTATTATTATDAQGLTGDPNIQVTNATVLGNLDVQGTTTTIDTAITEVDSLNVEGSVGIGTTNPATKLNVVGDARVEGFSNAKIQIKRTGNTVANGSIEFLGSDDSFGWGLIANYDAGGSNFNIKEGSDSRLYIKSGVVGINTDVSGNGSGAKLVVGGRIQSNAGGYWIASASGAEDGWHVQDSSGNLTINESGVAERLRINSSGNVVATGSVSDSIGSLRDVPLNDQSSSASYTLTASDAGKVVHAHSTTTTVVVPNSVFSVGNVVTILNGGTSNISINQGSGLSLRNSGDGSTGNRTLAQYGMATIYFTGASVCYISGSNMT